VWLEGGKKPAPLVTFPERINKDAFWEGGAHFTIKDPAHDDAFVRLTFDDAHAQAFRAAVLSCLEKNPHTGRPFWDDVFFKHPLGKAYHAAYTLAPEDTVTWQPTPWQSPLFERTVRAFFERPGTVSIAPLPEEGGKATLLRFREIAQEYPLNVQQTAFIHACNPRYAWDQKRVSYVAVHPRLGMERLLQADLRGQPYKNDTIPTFWAFEQALLSDDHAFFEAVASARVVLNGHPFSFEKRRSAWQTEMRDPELCVFWRSITLIHDRACGFAAKDTPEGFALFAESLGTAASFALGGSPFKRPMSASTSPLMRQAFDDPVFLEALDSTGFWETLKNTPDRHPEWEAVLERRLLQTRVPTQPKERVQPKTVQAPQGL
jgi:hypothetical protein